MLISYLLPNLSPCVLNYSLRVCAQSIASELINCPTYGQLFYSCGQSLLPVTIWPFQDMTQCGMLRCDLIEPVKTSYGASTCCFLLESAHSDTEIHKKHQYDLCMSLSCVICFPGECVHAAVDHESLHTQPFTNMCMHTHMAWLQLGQLTVLTGSRVFVQSRLQCLNSLSNR